MEQYGIYVGIDVAIHPVGDRREVSKDQAGIADYLLDRDAGAKDGPGHVNGTASEPAPTPSDTMGHHNGH